MPIPVSKRGTPITPAEFDQSYESDFVRFGLKGLNINDAIDAIEPNELTRMLNVTHRVDMGITGREGQVNVYGSAVGTRHHSIRRLNTTDDYTRVVGVDSSVYMGKNSLSLMSTGYSGDPLSLTPYRPTLNGQSWMMVADPNKMLKVRQDGLALSLGLGAPSNAATTALAAEQRTTIANFLNDGTEYTNWTSTPGSTFDNPPVPIDGASVSQVVNGSGNYGCNYRAELAATTATGYFAWWGCPHTVNLTKVGSVDASDDDLIHLGLTFSHTAFIQEFRVYLVCSASFNSTVLPGISDAAGDNSDAYVKSFSSNDFAGYIQGQLTQVQAAELARIRDLRNQNLTNNSSTPSTVRLKNGAVVTTTLANTDQARTIPQLSNAASDQEQQFGIIGVPLRRGDWQRIGTTSGRDWSNITGIIVYVQTAGNDIEHVGTTEVRLTEMWLTGGSGPDSSEPPDSPYDYRYTNYDPRTGAESNGSPIMAEANFLDSLRRSIVVTPTAAGSSALQQRIYRRGGTLNEDWYFVGTNTSDGAAFTDSEDDTTAVASTTLEDDNYQPVPTVDASGNTILAQPLSSLWGPHADLLFGVGDPYQPGNVYYCKPGNPDAWPPDYRTEVTSPSEPLICGVMYNSQSFVFSTERAFVLYPNFSGEIPTVTATNTQCHRGPIARWAITVGLGGIFFVNNDGIYRTVGGPEEWISKKIDPLFQGKFKNGLYPIDFTAPEQIRLEIFENELWFQYQDTNSSIQVMVYSLPFQFWRRFQFGKTSACFYTDEGNNESVMLIGGATTGKTYSFEGTSDDGSAISCSMRTGALDFGKPRLEKRLGDQWLDYESANVEITLQNLIDFESATNTAVLNPVTTGRQTAILDDFGTTPERVKNISTDISWSTAQAPPIIYQLASSIITEPDITINRVTQWDDLGHPDASYLMGVTFDCDTGGTDRTIIIERDYDGSVSTVATLTVNASGRAKLKFSWPAQLTNKVRVRPDDTCVPWQLFRVDWIAQPEPPKIAGWDSYFENAWDQYYTGLDLYCDTFGQTKTVVVYVDGVPVKTESVNTSGRRVHHITLPWGRGHVFHFVATDDNPGVLYDYRWQLEAEPSEQTNWNQNFTTQAALYDKYLKAIVVECDTFGADKTVTVECDGTVVETLTINADGRKVVQKAFEQHLGRVFRVYPTDDNPSRLYSLQFVFDGEPFALDRWETQEITHGMSGWSYATYGNITVRSTANVTLSVTAYNQDGTATTEPYTLTSTAGAKVKKFVPFVAMKGILHKYVLTSAEPFYLYQEETTLFIREWGTDQTQIIHPFGDSDVDLTRNMVNSALAVRRPGGTNKNG